VKKRSGYFTRSEVVEALRLAIGMTPKTQFAAKLGITPQVLNDALTKRRPIPESALEFLGVEPVEQVYRRRVK